MSLFSIPRFLERWLRLVRVWLSAWGPAVIGGEALRGAPGPSGLDWAVRLALPSPPDKRRSSPMAEVGLPEAERRRGLWHKRCMGAGAAGRRLEGGEAGRKGEGSSSEKRRFRPRSSLGLERKGHRGAGALGSGRRRRALAEDTSAGGYGSPNRHCAAPACSGGSASHWWPSSQS